MPDASKSVSIVEVGFAGVLLAVRRWPTALAVVAIGATAPIANLGAIAVTQTADRPMGAFKGPILVIALLFLGIGIGQLLTYFAVLRGRRKPLLSTIPAWLADLARILVINALWLGVGVFVGAAAVVGISHTPWGRIEFVSNWVTLAAFLLIVSAALMVIGLAAPASFEQRRWLLLVRPPPWRDHWRILAGYLIVAAQVSLVWWLVQQGIEALGDVVARRLVSGVRFPLFLRVGEITLGIGFTELLIIAAWTQAWRQGLGRPAEDPAAVFD